MTLVKENVNVTISGDFSYAPLGTALPATPSAALNAAFLSVGYIGEEGVVASTPETLVRIKAHQNGDIVRVFPTDHEASFKLTLLETNANTLALYFKGNWTPGVGLIKAGAAPHHAWVLHHIDGTNLIRTTIADGQITEIGDVVYKNGQAIGYPIKIEAFPDGTTAVKATQMYATATVSA